LFQGSASLELCFNPRVLAFGYWPIAIVLVNESTRGNAYGPERVTTHVARTLSSFPIQQLAKEIRL